MISSKRTLAPPYPPNHRPFRVPLELMYLGDASGAGGSRIGAGEPKVDAESKKWILEVKTGCYAVR